VIFIFGSPRSGTTWLGKIFDSHPEVRYLHEPEIALPPQVPQFPKDMNWKQLTPGLVKSVEAWKYTSDLRTCGTLPVFRKSTEGVLGHGYRKGQVFLGKSIEKLIPTLSRCFSVRKPPVGCDQLFVIKTVNLLGRAGLFMHALPDARCVFLVRHPCGQIASVLRGLRKDGNVSSLSYSAIPTSPLGERERVSLGALEQAGALERLAWKWAAFNDAAYKDVRNNPRSVFVRYEDVTARPMDMVGELFSKIGLSWDSQVEGFIGSSVRARGSSRRYSLKRNPQQAAQRWKGELQDDEVSQIREIVCRTAIGRKCFDN